LHLLTSLPSEGQSLWANQISSTYLKWWLRYNYFRFWKTNVRHIGILLPLSISTNSRNLRFILHHATDFSPNRSTQCRNMTSYPFSRWRPRPLNTSSGFVFVDVAAFRRSKFISKPNFVAIDSWDITTSVFEKLTSAILEIYFRFWSRPFGRNLHIILH